MHTLSNDEQQTISSKAPSPFIFARASSPHAQHPERNEDYILIDRHYGLVAVLDGVGGREAGEVASRLAAQTIRKSWQHMRQQQQSTQTASPISSIVPCGQIDLDAAIQQLLEDANQQLLIKGEQLSKATDSKQQPETTVVLLILCQQKDGYAMTYAHVGDSRLYLLREGEPLQRLTDDDGYLSILLNEQTISRADALRIDQAARTEDLDETEHSYFAKRNGITQSLGQNKPLDIHLGQSTLIAGDRILLCTDGIHDNLTDQEIADTLAQSGKTTVAKRLVQQAIERSHQHDDTTIRAKADDMSALMITVVRQ